MHGDPHLAVGPGEGECRHVAQLRAASAPRALAQLRPGRTRDGPSSAPCPSRDRALRPSRPMSTTLTAGRPGSTTSARPGCGVVSVPGSTTKPTPRALSAASLRTQLTARSRSSRSGEQLRRMGRDGVEPREAGTSDPLHVDADGGVHRHRDGDEVGRAGQRDVETGVADDTRSAVLSVAPGAGPVERDLAGGAAEHTPEDVASEQVEHGIRPGGGGIRDRRQTASLLGIEGVVPLPRRCEGGRRREPGVGPADARPGGLGRRGRWHRPSMAQHRSARPG